ncbi:MAG: FAD/NAD(P)-binding protein [Actinobacteria bacterium]|nr:FAD/NAD(P)-binding protein [Cyanobacteriota bacterium]MCL6087258.1 FAD/NAD(P)-binding protein [Actinomycetota bacterium]
MKNEYFPFPAIIENIKTETVDTKTFRVCFTDKALADSFNYQQGQFMELSLPGAGEAPISISSSPSRKGFLEFTIRAAGKVTKSIHMLKKDDYIYIRGPYGNFFPFEEIIGKNIYFVAGGIGLAPLRSLINLVMDNRSSFRHIKILYGARTPDELCFKNELKQWETISDTEVWLTVDKTGAGWSGRVGVVTELWKDTHIDPTDAVSIVCGPPIMIKFAAEKLEESGFKDKDIFMTLERYMKCGIGKCGHCNIDDKFICKDGPVFTYEQIKSFRTKEHIF